MDEHAIFRGGSLLETLTPQKIIEDFGSKEDCTVEIIELIRTTPHSLIRKLQTVFLGLENFGMESLLELTQSKIRLHRYISTFLIFSKIKVLCRGASNCDKIEALYSTVFVVRFRDVDPAIRSMCVQFISEWAVECEALRKMEFLKYVGWGLNDKNDMVRRRAIKAFICISRLKDDAQLKRGSIGSATAKRQEILEFLEKYKGRLIEISESDCNANLQRDCCKTILAIYIKKRDLFTKEQILRVIGLDEGVNSYKTQALKIICPETIWDFPALHETIRQSDPRIFRNLSLSDKDVDSFVLNIVEFAKTDSACCESNHLCFLDVLKELPSNTNLQGFIALFGTIKDNKDNVKRVVQSLLCVTSFKEHPGTTFELLNLMYRTIFTGNSSMEAHCVEDFVLLLKKLEDDFSIQVEEIVSKLKITYPISVIKSFDISDCVTDSSQPILKCYAALWAISRGDFGWIDALQFSDEAEDGSENRSNLGGSSAVMGDTEASLDGKVAPICTGNKPECYLGLVDFLEFFHSASTTFSVTKATDVPSASKVVFGKLYDFISKNFYFEDQESCLHLFKLISSGVFLNYASRLFRHCSEEQLRYFIGNVKNIKHIALGFFDFIGSERKFYQLAKPIAGRIGKAARAGQDRYLLAPLKRLVKRLDLLDSVLLHFVPLLDVNECIVLESLAPRSKFKSLCLRRCKAIKPVKSEGNITFI